MMHNLTVVRPEGTFFKTSTADSSVLSPSDKLAILGGRLFNIFENISVEKNHYKVNFDEQFGDPNRNPWYVYRPHVYVEEVTETPYKMHIYRQEGTVFKTSTQDSSELSTSEKVEVIGNIYFGVSQYEYEPVSNHYKVTLSGQLGDKKIKYWYVYAPHISIFRLHIPIVKGIANLSVAA